MSVEDVLEKISEHNSDVLGCIAVQDGTVYSRLPDMYDLVDTTEVIERAQNMLDLTDGLETEHAAFDQMFLEYEHHSVYARRLNDGVLLLLNKPIDRSRFKKMQVGVNLFLKSLNKALESANQPASEATEAGAIRRTNRKRWF